MKFRTEIERLKSLAWIEPNTKITLLGSCFSDNIGKLLENDGFDVCHNPFGALYNPLSIASCLTDVLNGRKYVESDFVQGPLGWHCLDYATRYSSTDSQKLATELNEGLIRLEQRLLHEPEKQVLILTFGSAYAYFYKGEKLVGNCHKFPGSDFDRRRLSVEQIVEQWCKIIDILPANVQIIFTISPVRHLADGLHGNRVSKAVLLLAVDELCKSGKAVYFPAYEILEDDLRDYRFYKADLKHPNEMAVEYIYDCFSDFMFTEAACMVAKEARRRSVAAAHRQILND